MKPLHYYGRTVAGDRSIIWVAEDSVYDLVAICRDDCPITDDQPRWGEISDGALDTAILLLWHATQDQEAAMNLASFFLGQVLTHMEHNWEMSRDYVRTWVRMAQLHRHRLNGQTPSSNCNGCGG